MRDIRCAREGAARLSQQTKVSEHLRTTTSADGDGAGAMRQGRQGGVCSPPGRPCLPHPTRPDALPLRLVVFGKGGSRTVTPLSGLQPPAGLRSTTTSLRRLRRLARLGGILAGGTHSLPRRAWGAHA